MSVSKMIKLANKIERKYLISVADGNQITSASIYCEPDYETEYYIYLTVNGSVNGHNFHEKNLGIYITGAATFDSVDELAERLDSYLNRHLLHKKMIEEDQVNSLSLMKDYLNNAPAQEQNSWLKEVNDTAESQSNSWRQESDY